MIVHIKQCYGQRSMGLGFLCLFMYTMSILYNNFTLQHIKMLIHREVLIKVQTRF